jgi:hypothetical protein
MMHPLAITRACVALHDSLMTTGSTSRPATEFRELPHRPERPGWDALWVVGAVIFAILTAWASAHSLFPGEQWLAKWLQSHQYPTVLGYEEFADLVGARITLYVLTALGLVLFLALRR